MAAALSTVWRQAPQQTLREALHHAKFCPWPVLGGTSRNFSGKQRQPVHEDEPWAVLGVAPTASAGEIKAAYLRAALKTHPDTARGPDAQSTAGHFRRVLQAYRQLTGEQPRVAQARRPPQPAPAAWYSWWHSWQAEQERRPRAWPRAWQPRAPAVSAKEAETLFRKVFNGRGVQEVMKEEMTRAGISSARHGVHMNFMKEALYARLLQQARDTCRQDTSQRQQNNAGPRQSEAKVDVRRERWRSKATGAWFVRVRTSMQWPDGRVEETVSDKPLYRM
mmetsp:Transcript_141979/g.258067  ORF Transcript_141979/g.258067 Transcript_141979/m.258067 type:complete len:278 (-) Transcript_141979:13-846(-)